MIACMKASARAYTHILTHTHTHTHKHTHTNKHTHTHIHTHKHTHTHTQITHTHTHTQTHTHTGARYVLETSDGNASSIPSASSHIPTASSHMLALVVSHEHLGQDRNQFMHDEIQRLRDGAKKIKMKIKMLSSCMKRYSASGAVGVVGILLYFVGHITVFYFTLFFLLL
jgi:hypothetical protein